MLSSFDYYEEAVVQAGEERPLFHFGVFELDLRAGELRKRGIRVKLQEQPLQILALLVGYAGEVVTREQIQKKLWSGETYVDFDNAINSAVRKMRDALGDNSDNPRFIETLARRGYRFIAPVHPHTLDTPPVVVQEAVPPQQPEATPKPAAPNRAGSFRVGIILCAISSLAGAGVAYWLKPGYLVPAAVETLTYSGRDSSPALSPDGSTLAFSSDRDGIPRIWLKHLKGGGEVALTSGADDWPRFSANGGTILFSRNEGVRRSLFKVASVGGEPRKLLEGALDGDFSPDGLRIAFIRWKHDNGRHTSLIGTSSANGSDTNIIAELPHVRLYSPRWSPDGSEIAVVGAAATTAAGVSGVAVWLVGVSNGRVRRLAAVVPERGISSVAWTDTRTIIYARGDRTTPVDAEMIIHNTSTDLMRRRPWRCCSLTLDVAGTGRLVFHEQATRSGLLETGINGETSRWLSHANSADRQPVFSPDGKWVAFTSNRDGHMNIWQISRETGTVSRLTEASATDYDPAFSPDGKHLIFTSDRSGHFETYMANLDGTGIRQVTHDGIDAENPTMTPDGQWLVYASDAPNRTGIWKIHPDGRDATQIVRGIGNNPEVSPDGVFALYITNPQPDMAEIHVVRISDGSEVPFRIQCWRRRQNGIGLGRARWVPAWNASSSPAIAFIGQDPAGATGVYIQDFIAGTDTTASRRPLRPFDPIAPLETLGVSPDGKRVVVSVADDTSSIMSSSQIPDVTHMRRTSGQPR